LGFTEKNNFELRYHFTFCFGYNFFCDHVWILVWCSRDF